MALQNKLGITDSAELAREEERISKKKAVELYDKGLLDELEAGKFSSLAFIHKYLFEEIYDFAGVVRDVNIAKGGFRFAPVMYLDSALEHVSNMPQSTFDEIIEKFNAHYANAGAEMEEMIDSLFKDEDLRMNVKNSAPSAYEYAASEKLSERINTHMLDGLMTGNQEKVEYYNELSGDKNTQKQICNRIIRKIKDWLNLAS